MDTHSAMVFLVDDHPMVRQGLAQFLIAAGFSVSGEADGSASALAHPELECSTVVVVDLSLVDESGIDLIPKLCERGLKVVVYSMHEDSTVIRRALAAGALGYVAKREAPQQLLEAIREANRGTVYHSPRIREALSTVEPENLLSDRQQRIFELLGEGCSNEEIARRLDISVRTLESYFVRIIDKLGVKGVRELRQQAIRVRRSADLEKPPTL